MIQNKHEKRYKISVEYVLKPTDILYRFLYRFLYGFSCVFCIVFCIIFCTVFCIAFCIVSCIVFFFFVRTYKNNRVPVTVSIRFCHSFVSAIQWLFSGFAMNFVITIQNLSRICTEAYGDFVSFFVSLFVSFFVRILYRFLYCFLYRVSRMYVQCCGSSSDTTCNKIKPYYLIG